MTEAKAKSGYTINGYNTTKIMGVGVASTSVSSVLEIINEQCTTNHEHTPFFVITAYSESFLQNDAEFKKALDKANLIVGDGVSVVAAIDYLNSKKLGLQIGLNILQGKYKPVRGIDIFKSELKSKHKIYLSGGFNNVAKRLAEKYPSVVGWDNGDRDVKKINATDADILFVSLGRFKQEIWIAQNLHKLNVKVVIGVGSAFDEVDENWQVPGWVNNMGLKWLWRITRDPKHLIRAINAFRFPFKVFLQKNST